MSPSNKPKASRRQSDGKWSTSRERERRDSGDSLPFDPMRGPLPPLFDLTAIGRDEPVFHFSRYINAALSTGLFRIWPSLVLLSGWAAAVVCINKYTEVNFVINNGLLGVFGTVLGFVLSYRVASAYDRYWSARTLWSTVTVACRQWARCVWISCPDATVKKASDDPEEKTRDAVRAVIEKRSMINIALAFAISLKHYLRGEEGVYYEDLWFLVKHLPGYQIANTIPYHPGVGPDPYSPEEAAALQTFPMDHTHEHDNEKDTSSEQQRTKAGTWSSSNASQTAIPLDTRPVVGTAPTLRPARNPPPDWKLRDIWPFYLFRKTSLKDAARLETRREIKERQKRGVISQNFPLECTFHMQSYVRKLTDRDTVDPLTRGNLNTAIQSLTDSLTSLERILTTPIPFSYKAHIWTVAYLYVILLPVQIVSTFQWITIPATSVITFLFLGFLAIGDEIEQPLGYDANDLNLDLFTSIIRSELAAVTSRPLPDIESWIFSSANDSLFGEGAENSSNPNQLLDGGVHALRRSLAVLGGSDPNVLSAEGLRLRGAAAFHQQQQQSEEPAGARAVEEV